MVITFFFLPKTLICSMERKPDLILRDWLAIERTKLANERTFLAYFRTAFVFLATGVTILKVDSFASLHWLGWIFIGLFPITLVFGIIRFIKTKKGIDKHYN